jgi:putative hydroxymethylpyrimidine transport system ATP-binding protein
MSSHHAAADHVRGPGVALTGRARVDGRPLWGPLDLALGAGRWTCLLGPSGAGKTTLLRLVAGLETGADFDGAVTAGDGRPLAGRVTVMGQSPALPPWLGVLGAVTLGARLAGRTPDRDRAMAMIARVGLAGLEHRRPAQLSGGQAQRAALARALVEDRPVVVLDEPFAALDARTRAEMQDLAFATLAGRTVLLATHDPLEAARLGHEAWVLQDGRLSPLPLPAPAPPRSLDDPATLAAQAAIFARLRGAAA